MNDFTLTLAMPESADDCVAEPFLPLVRPPLWVAYLRLGHLYLADVNDDPDLEESYDTGIGLWVKTAQALLDVFKRRSDDLLVQISVSTQAGARRFFEQLTGQGTHVSIIKEAAAIDPDFLEGLTTYGGEATMWTCLPHERGTSSADETMTIPRLEEWIRDGATHWWISHGYKEPFLVGQTPMLNLDALADVIRTYVGIHVELANKAFVPHRIRMHRRLLKMMTRFSR